MRARTALIAGASRTLGLGLATEYAHRGWDVFGTVRGSRRTALHDLAEASRGPSHGRVTGHEEASAGHRAARAPDVAHPRTAVRQRGHHEGTIPIGDIPEEIFAEVMVTNTLSPMRIVECLRLLVAPTGTIGVMSSRQGSISLNTNGGQDVYRASKSALNQLMPSYAARYADAAHTPAHLPRPCPHRTRRAGRTADHRPARPAATAVPASHACEVPRRACTFTRSAIASFSSTTSCVTPWPDGPT
ncbi:SDR family NAD(P)-dependent oxidoreductase [Streptomyces sp. NPDC058644]|uniref:SDR family NAD(P)-dependent oxidoreductase n=1 Tax=unclassified Streptomyces TaxID=2593676 RepID=UPI0036668B8D